MNNQKLKNISIFFPCYNDNATIASLVIMAFKVAKQIADDHEVLVIDDGSKDNSKEVLEELKRIFPKFRTIYHEKNMGYGAVLRTGFREAGKDLIFYTDGDAQYDVRELHSLIPMLEDDVDIVNGFKLKRLDPFYRVIIGIAYHWMAKFMFGLKVKDVDCDFRLIRARVLKNIELESDSGVICVELIKKIQDAGFKFAYVGVNHSFRAHGKSQFFSFHHLLTTFFSIINLWFKLIFWPCLKGLKPNYIKK